MSFQSPFEMVEESQQNVSLSLSELPLERFFLRPQTGRQLRSGIYDYDYEKDSRSGRYVTCKGKRESENLISMRKMVLC